MPITNVENTKKQGKTKVVFLVTNIKVKHNAMRYIFNRKIPIKIENAHIKKVEPACVNAEQKNFTIKQ